MVQIETQGCKMVRMIAAAPTQAYDMYDVGGRHLGQVVAPAGPPRLGPGAGTILLHRMPESRSADR
jgi:hypothetical protein